MGSRTKFTDVKFLSKERDLNNFYIDLPRLVKGLQKKLLENFISNNFSKDHARVYRYLNVKGLTDVSELEQNCCFHCKDARKILYLLHINGVIF